MSRAKIERAQCIVLAQKHRALSIFIGRSPRVTIRGANCDMRTAHGCCSGSEARESRFAVRIVTGNYTNSAILVTPT